MITNWIISIIFFSIILIAALIWHRREKEKDEDDAEDKKPYTWIVHDKSGTTEFSLKNNKVSRRKRRK